MRRISRSLVLVVVAALPLTGCLVVPIMVARNLTAESTVEVDAELETAFQATVDELQERGHAVEDPRMSGSVATMVSEDAWVVEEQLPEDRTRIHLGIGEMATQAEQDEARQVVEDVARRVGDPDAARRVELREPPR